MAVVGVNVSMADYLQSADVAQITRTCQLASAIVVLYDHAITFDREVDHVWTLASSYGSITYLLIRYIGDALSILNIFAFLGLGVHSQTGLQGDVYFYVQAWLGMLILFLIQLMLQVRLHALYRGSKIVLILMIVGYVCEIVAISTIMGFVDAYSEITNEALEGLYICSNMNSPSFYRQYVNWLPVIAYDGLLCLLALWYGFGHWMSGYRIQHMERVSITDSLVAGNASYFVCIVVGCVVSVIIGQRVGLDWTAMYEGYPAAMQAMVGCRLILSLRLLFARTRECEESGEDAPWIAAVVRPLSTLLV